MDKSKYIEVGFKAVVVLLLGFIAYQEQQQTTSLRYIDAGTSSNYQRQGVVDVRVVNDEKQRIPVEATVEPKIKLVGDRYIQETIPVEVKNSFLSRIPVTNN